jgi:hypothetical protein
MSRRARAIVLSVTLLFSSGCSGGTKYIGSHGESAECAAPVAPPTELELDPFYERYLDARGIPVVSSASVSDAALERACDAAIHMLSKDADVRARLSDNGFRVAVIGVDEVLTDLPEYSDLYELYPNVDWNYTVRSVGAGSVDKPVSSVGEENLLCLSEDLFVGESIAVHSIAHGLRSLGIVYVDPEWDERLSAAYDESMAAGLWTNTYAATGASQYWAEGVQSWYDANLEAAPPDGLHNEVNTRSELRDYDSELAALIAEYVPEDDWRLACPTPIPP